MSGCKLGYYSFFSPRSCFSALASMVRKTPSACILTSAPPCRAGRPRSGLTTLLTPAAACHRTPAAVGTRGRRAGVAAEGAEGRGAGGRCRRTAVTPAALSGFPPGPWSPSHASSAPRRCRPTRIQRRDQRNTAPGSGEPRASRVRPTKKGASGVTGVQQGHGEARSWRSERPQRHRGGSTRFSALPCAQVRQKEERGWQTPSAFGHRKAESVSPTTRP